VRKLVHIVSRADDKKRKRRERLYRGLESRTKEELKKDTTFGFIIGSYYFYTCNRILECRNIQYHGTSHTVLSLRLLCLTPPSTWPSKTSLSLLNRLAQLPLPILPASLRTENMSSSSSFPLISFSYFSSWAISRSRCTWVDKECGTAGIT